MANKEPIKYDIQLNSNDYTDVFYWTLHSDKPLVIHQGGTSSSKTYSIMQYLILKAICESNVTILVVAADVSSLKKGAFKDFKDILRHQPEFAQFLEAINKNELLATFTTGSTIQFDSVKDGQDGKAGKRDYTFIDEANGLGVDVFEALEVRTFRQLIIAFNADRRFWAHDVIDDHRHLGDCDYFISNFTHNKFCPEKVVRTLKGYKEKNIEKWRVYGLGLIGRVEGTIFTNEIIRVDEWDWDNCYRKCITIDFGFSRDPTAIILCGMFEGDYVFEEILFETRVSDEHILGILTKYFPDFTVVCDRSSSKSIAYLQHNGIDAIASNSSPESVLLGLSRLTSRKIYLVNNYDNIYTEVCNYAWRKVNGVYINKPINRYDHSIDAMRYYVLMDVSGKGNTSQHNYKKEYVAEVILL